VTRNADAMRYIQPAEDEEEDTEEDDDYAS